MLDVFDKCGVCKSFEEIGLDSFSEVKADIICLVNRNRWILFVTFSRSDCCYSGVAIDGF